MNVSRRILLAPLLALGLLVAAGCGSGRPAIKGMVKWQGKPIPEGNIGFIPKDGGDRASASAAIKDGAYSFESGKGPNTGPYQVQVTWEKKTGKKVGVPGEMGLTQDETVQMIPDYYNTKTTLTADVKSSGEDINFDLLPK